MSEERLVEERLVQQALHPERTFKILGCKGKVVTTVDGKKHFEIECGSKKDRDEVAAIFEEEAILRINPKVVLDDTPPPGSDIEPPAGSQE